MNLYYKTANGEFVPKKKVDDALELIGQLAGGCSIVQLSDSEVISFGNKIDAISLFRQKYDCSLLEAKAAIEFLRAEV